MSRTSAGLLLFRRAQPGIEVLLAHMGGPLWAKRDSAAWSIPKGEYTAEEEPLAAARREFEEELGLPAPDGDLVELGAIRQAGGKLVTAWAIEHDLDPGAVIPGTFKMEWPRGSGQIRDFPEVDRVAWLDLEAARSRIVTGQRAFLDRLGEHLAGEPA